MNEQSVPRKSLISKLISACRAIEAIEKRGKNDEYEWLRAVDVNRAARREFFKRGLLIMPNEIELTEKLRRNHAGLLLIQATLKVEYTVHSSSGTLGPFAAFGSGLDIGDKSVYKAKTGALKHFIKNMAMLAEVGDDPEVDTHKPKDAADYDPKLKARASSYQQRAWDAGRSEYGKTEKQCIDYLRSRFNLWDDKGTPSDELVKLLKSEEFDSAMNWCVGREEISKTLLTSIDAAKKPNGNSAA